MYGINQGFLIIASIHLGSGAMNSEFPWMGLLLIAVCFSMFVGCEKTPTPPPKVDEQVTKPQAGWIDSESGPGTRWRKNSPGKWKLRGSGSGSYLLPGMGAV